MHAKQVLYNYATFPAFIYIYICTAMVIIPGKDEINKHLKKQFCFILKVFLADAFQLHLLTQFALPTFL